MDSISIREIKQLLAERQITSTQLIKLREDERKGVQRLIRLYDKQLEKERQLTTAFFHKQQFDAQYKTKSNSFLLAGVDEAGRGPLAGPLVTAAVILPADFNGIGLDDSKKMTEAERLVFYKKIQTEAIAYSVTVISNEEIDQINIYEATKKGMSEALTNLAVLPDIALLDAMKINTLPFQTEKIIKGDEKSLAIAAASVLAKVTRDRIMQEIAVEFPMYDFANNKGYGTAQHLAALKEYGPSRYHRVSFSPVQKLLQ